eukprot:2924992-Amphidinium_carterae.1
MTAWRTGIRHLSRDASASLHGCRILALLDSQVVSCSIQKGRSTSHRLNTLLQSIAGTCLLSKQSVIPLWISSKSNAADDPTRVSRVRDAVPDRPATLAFGRVRSHGLGLSMPLGTNGDAEVSTWSMIKLWDSPAKVPVDPLVVCSRLMQKKRSRTCVSLSNRSQPSDMDIGFNISLSG